VLGSRLTFVVFYFSAARSRFTDLVSSAKPVGHIILVVMILILRMLQVLYLTEMIQVLMT